MRSVSGIAVLVAIAMNPVSCRAQEAPTPSRIDVERIVVEYSRSSGVPGVTVAYVLGGEGVERFAGGVADLETATPMPPAARMPVGSVGKTWVAALVVSLVQDGVLDLDAPMSRWLGGRPWFDRVPNHDAVTLRMLLSHTSGIPDHVFSNRFVQAARERATGGAADPDFASIWSCPKIPTACVAHGCGKTS